MCFFFVVFCLFLRFSKDLLILAYVISEVAQRCTVFAHFGNMSSKLVFYSFMRVIFGVAKKLQIRAQAPCTSTKIALCARATFVFTSGRGLTFTSAHVMVRAPIDGQGSQPTDTEHHTQTACRGGADGVAWCVCVCVCLWVCVCVCVGEGRGGERERVRRSFERAFKFLNCLAVSYSYITYGEKVNGTDLMSERENPPNST